MDVIGLLEAHGRLKYIDGAMDSILFGPIKKGDPIINALYMPPGIHQTIAHASLDAGRSYYRGRSTGRYPTGRAPTQARNGFLPTGERLAQVPHRYFRQKANAVRVSSGLRFRAVGRGPSDVKPDDGRREVGEGYSRNPDESVSPAINVVMATYARPEMFEVAATSALANIPNIAMFVVVLQSDYDPALLSPRLSLVRCAPDGNAGIARQRGFSYLAEHSTTEPTFLMDDDMVIEPGFGSGLPLVLDLLSRTSTGFIQCAMKHNPVSRTREVTLANMGGGMFCRSSMVAEIGGLGDDILDDVHSYLKAALAGFRNYVTGQIINQHLLGSKGGLQASTGSKDRWEKRFRTRSASRLNELYPGVFRKLDPVNRVFEVNKAALPAKRP